MKQIKTKFLISLAFVLGLATVLFGASHAQAAEINIVSPSSGSTIYETSFNITGTATANSAISVTINGSSVGSTTSDSSGNWSLAVSNLPIGIKTIEATAKKQLIYTNVLNASDATTSRMSRINTVTNQEESSFSIYDASAFPITWKPNPTFTKAYGVAPYLHLGTVWVMDLVTGSVTTFTLPGSGQRGASVAYNEDGTKVYITDNANTCVYVYDTSDESLIAGPITVGTAPHSNTKRPNHDEIWLDNSGDNTVSVIDTTSDTVIHTYSTDASPNGLTFSPDGTRAYVGISGDGDPSNAGIQILDADTGSSIGFINGTAAPEWIIINSTGTKLYSSTPSSNKVDVFNLQSESLETSIIVPTGPWGLALNADNSRLYITSPNLLGGLNGTTISVVYTANNTVEDSIVPGDGSPFFIYSAPQETATTTSTFTLASAESTLASTGDNRVELITISLLVLLIGNSSISYIAIKK